MPWQNEGGKVVINNKSSKMELLFLFLLGFTSLLCLSEGAFQCDPLLGCQWTRLELMFSVKNSSVKAEGFAQTGRRQECLWRIWQNSRVLVGDSTISAAADIAAVFEVKSSDILLKNISLFPSQKSQPFPELISSLLFDDGIGRYGVLEVSLSRIEEMVLESGPLFSSPAFRSVGIRECVFRNMSVAAGKGIGSEGSGREDISIGSSDFRSVCDVFTGGIVDGMHGQSLSLWNNTHFGCTRSLENGTRRILAVDTTIRSERFENQRTESTSSGEWTTTDSGSCVFMKHNSSASLSVSGSIFQNCTCGYCGGAIMCQNISSVVITNSSFNVCRAVSGGHGGALFMNSIGGCYFFSSISFNSCYASSIGGCSLFYTVPVPSLSNCITDEQNGEISEKFQFSDLSCRNCSSQKTGAFSMLNEISSFFRMRNCLFEGCSILGEDAGGALSITSNGLTKDNPQLFFFCLFFNNTATRAGFGHDVCLNDEGSRMKTTSPFVESLTLTKGGKQLAHCNSTCHANSEWLRYGFAKRIVAGEEGMDKEECGWSDGAGCRTVKYAVESELSMEGCVVSVKGGEHTEFTQDGIAGGVKTVRIRGSEEGGGGTRFVVVQVGSGHALFSVSSGKLSVESVSVEYDSDAGSIVGRVTEDEGMLSLVRVQITSSASTVSHPFGVSLFQVEKGSLHVEGCQLSSLCVSDVPLVRLSALSAFRNANATFQSIVRVRGSGCVMEREVGEGEEVEMDNVTLRQCTCLDGDGGAIALTLSSTGKVRVGASEGVAFSSCTVSADGTKKGKGGGVYLRLVGGGCGFVLDRVSFSECGAWKGRNVFVKADNLSGVITGSSVRFEVTGMEDEDLMGFEEGCGAEAVPLKAYLAGFGGSGYVGGAGELDFSGCGTAAYPCETIRRAVSVLFEGKKRKVILNEGFRWREAVGMEEQEWDVKCVAEDTNIVVAPVGSLAEEAVVVVSSAKASFTNIRFSFGSSGSGHFKRWILCKGGEASMSYCRIGLASSTGKLENSFADVTGGSLRLFHLSVDGVLVDSYSVIRGLKGASGGSIELEGCVFTGVELSSGSIVEAGGVRNVNVSGCTFEGISRGCGSGGGVSVRNGDDEDDNEEGAGGVVVVEGCTFERCSVSEEGKGGGGLSASMGVQGASGMAKILKCTFRQCSAQSGSFVGYGGGMLIELLDADASFVVSSPTFPADGANSARYGRDVFVVSPNLSRSVCEETMLFALAVPLQDTDSMMGYEGEDKRNAIPLVYVVNPVGSTIVVSSAEGVDVSCCGFEEYPCLTLKHSFWRQQGKKKSILISEGFELNERVELSDGQGYVMSGASEKSGVHVNGGEDGEGGVIRMKGSSAFAAVMKLMCFALPGSLGRHAFLISQEGLGEMGIEQCDFVSESAESVHSFTIVRCVSGIVVLKTVHMSGVHFGDGHFVEACGDCVVRMESCIVADVRTASVKGVVCVQSEQASLLVKDSSFRCSSEGEESFNVLYCSGMKEVVIEGSEFEGSRCRDGNGSAMLCRINSGGAMKVEGGGLKRGKSVGGSGGGIHVCVERGGKLEIGNGTGAVPTLFENCEALKESVEGGYGGGVCLRLIEDDGMFGMKNVGFSSCRADAGGNWVFVEGKRLKSIVKEETIGFEFEKEEGKGDVGDVEGGDLAGASVCIPLAIFFRSVPSVGHVGMGGLDYTICGYSDFRCSTIPYAGLLLFGGSERTGTLKLEPVYVLEEGMQLSKESLCISGEVPEAGIEVKGDASNTQQGLVETRTEISFEDLAFGLPSTLIGSVTTSLFMCSNSVLKVEECSFGSESESVEYSVVFVKGGRVEMFGCLIRECVFVGAGVVEFGEGVCEGVMKGVEMEGVRREDAGSLVKVRKGGDVELESCVVGDCAEGEGNGVGFEEGASIRMRNSTFGRMKRKAGDGGVVDGVVGEGEEAKVENCTFEYNGCDASSSKGGSVIVRVCARGRFVFERNVVNRSTVPSGSGLGGGVHLTLGDVDVEYSMKEDVFEENGAFRGKDVYMVCPQPRLVIVPILWNGSATTKTEEEQLWVRELEFGESEGHTMMEYLFPSQTAFVFVKGGGSAVESCGYRELPCATVDNGLARMGERQTSIRLLGETAVEGVIERGGESLTVEGNEEEQRLVVGRDAKFVMKEGTMLTQLTLSSLCVVLPMNNEGSSEEDCVVSGAIGQCNAVRCRFVSGKKNGVGCGKWVVKGLGSRVRIEESQFEEICFVGGGGIVEMVEGEAVLRKVRIEGVSAGGSIVVVDGVGASCRFEGCEVCGVECCGEGSVHVEGGGSIVIGNGTKVGSCVLREGNGGAVHGKMGEAGMVTVANATIEGCKVDAASRLGGGIYVEVEGEREGGVLFSEVVFGENEAFEGRDIYFVCFDLNESVSASNFNVSVFDENGEVVVEMEGRDRKNFGESVEFLLFLVEYCSASVVVGAQGVDVVGCGTSMHPCGTLGMGLQHLDESPSRRLVIADKVEVGECFSLRNEMWIGSGEKGGGENEKGVKMVFVPNGKADGMSAKGVLDMDGNITFSLIGFEVSALLSVEQEALMYLQSGCVRYEKCVFCEAESVDSCLVKSVGKEVHLSECSMSTMSVLCAALQLHSSVSMQSCYITNVKAGTSKKGGAVFVERKSEEGFVIVNSSSIVGCECSLSEGFGGFAFIDCSSDEASEPFRFISLKFGRNNARTGRNMFLVGGDLNSSVKESTFDCEVFGEADEEEEDDGNLFVGRDKVFTGVDLLCFLEDFKSDVVHVSADGYDVKRCGRAVEPCRTFWEGMNHIPGSGEQHTLVVGQSAHVSDEYVLSHFSICSGDDEAEGVRSELVFGRKSGATRDSFLCACDELNCTNICFRATALIDGTASVVMEIEKGNASLENCEWKGSEENESAAGCSFVRSVNGSLFVHKLNIASSSLGASVFVVDDISQCVFSELRVSLIDESIDSLISVSESEIQTSCRSNGMSKKEGSVLVEKSQFLSVHKSDDCSSVISTSADLSVCVCVNSSTFTECRASASGRGGAMRIMMGAGSQMQILNSEMMRCCSSLEEGKGGGVYLASKETGDLQFLFGNMSFMGNEAAVGCDVFVSCFSIQSQINESQFVFDLERVTSREKSMFGVDVTEHKAFTNLMDFISVYQSDTIVVSSLEGRGGRNERQCGAPEQPCKTVEYGLGHLTNRFVSQMFVDGETAINSEVEMQQMSLSSRWMESSVVRVLAAAGVFSDQIVSTCMQVSVSNLDFVFEGWQEGSQQAFLRVVNGTVKMQSCLFCGSGEGEDGEEIELGSLFVLVGGNVSVERCSITKISFGWNIIEIGANVATISSSSISEVKCRGVVMEEASGDVTFERVKVFNVTASSPQGLISFASTDFPLIFENCTFEIDQLLSSDRLFSFRDCSRVLVESCVMRGCNGDCAQLGVENNEEESMCKWNGSLVECKESVVECRGTVIADAPEGGMGVVGGSVTIEKGEFSSNDPKVEGYPSVRRNIRCAGSGLVRILSVRGGDGLMPNTSLWIVNEGCTLEGIVLERASEFFIPRLESAVMEVQGEEIEIRFAGALLLPCDLAFRVVSEMNNVSSIETYSFAEEDFVSEEEVHGKISSSLISSAPAEAEVVVCVLFGNLDTPSATDSFILKNRSDPKATEDERIVEGGKKERSIWPIIVIVLVVILLIVLIVAVAFIIRWRKQKRRTEELEVIVEDTVKKDPKAFEMVTMEMSPEEQWGREERETEKKNEERIKKRVYDKTLEHSESSEHLLSESGSTEYILGRDSDKIPQWMLEKVDEKEEEETRKRTPSPSISSTCSTDSDSTFVRGEDLCPTTSSMSNLVDAMACSSPHEKLIVDLRDSLFMLLHGLNMTKEMAIGTLKEREMTAAQVLFWVANGALHSFDEMENQLQSLANLSPLIVLFSEHMVICVAMHSDCSSSDSDSSSISSSTVVTSTSDDGDERYSLPSSAFEDEDDFKKECLRWKAPELLNGEKKHATKKTVVFSIGMMLWECLTLDVPFGEYEAEVAGQKICQRERPELTKIEESELARLVDLCWSADRENRMSLTCVKREFLGCMPNGCLMMTMSDAISYDEDSNDGESGGRSSISSTDLSFR
ncbi:uncharacterized protein MONOS_4738 [Monocercomonoides exilis]|uniref:uncharacterized protein n=1 Tax=Monocercomonoides exilis TaxID=2049356 RepID=UPI00355A37A8|nr:hypothetical protein MONOS_4738 [Monocercomonoides exilis]|eukprot:MONOS_4738.1-p1 / transcript=MONOS_4738.1 / gene=MONOS_4738 / organism=Monocercomonoides_exilis_PA203 / gene_product=unspecified product / transcript_product=unspecified product / location=Mono_scaffold00130:31176-43446(+) / protein_length=4070 / sequence_SO=supercontig / SO=protein_coding / is_pseudo=false